MSELLINCYCPPASKSYDFWIPAGMTVKTAIGLICDDICEMEGSPGLFPERETLLLCSYLNRKTLPAELTLEQAGVRSGDRLALV